MLRSDVPSSSYPQFVPASTLCASDPRFVRNQSASTVSARQSMDGPDRKAFAQNYLSIYVCVRLSVNALTL